MKTSASIASPLVPLVSAVLAAVAEARLRPAFWLCHACTSLQYQPGGMTLCFCNS